MLHTIDELVVFATISVASLVTIYLAQYLGIVWLAAGASVSSLMFGAIAILGYLWRRFKQWRYPSHYDSEGDHET